MIKGFLLLCTCVSISVSVRVYSPEEIAHARNASDSPFDYPNMGLPSDVLVLGNATIRCQLLELWWMSATLYLQSIEEQSRYADMVTRSKAADEEWVARMLAPIKINHRFEAWKECSIGNAAYIALYASKQEHANDASTLLKEYRAWKEAEWAARPWQFYFSSARRADIAIYLMDPLETAICSISYYLNKLQTLFYPHFFSKTRRVQWVAFLVVPASFTV